MFIIERRRDFETRREFDEALKRSVETRGGIMFYESLVGQSDQTRALTEELDDLIAFYSDVLYGDDPNRLGAR